MAPANANRRAGDAAARSVDLADGSITPRFNAPSEKRKSGHRSRRKGAVGELDVVHIGQEAGFAVSKRSRMCRLGHDVDWPLLGIDRAIEVKRHARGQARLYAWLEPVYAVIHRGDRREWLVTLRLRDAIEIAQIAERQP